MGGAVVAEAQEIFAGKLADLSLEQLSDIRITSVSRTEEKLSSAAAAITVVSAEEIHRSGATNVPEALRMVPGIHVARQNASTWAVSSRGFSSANSRNLLVLSDTRSIYTPLFSGVFWDAQDYLMEDIDRIEVIRGPGASLWGSNAVNGVVSITTKHARDTQGIYTQAIVSTEDQGAAMRYGGTTEQDVYYRIFLKHSEHDNSHAPNAQSTDDWRISHLGFRADWDASVGDSFTLQGDYYEGHIGQLVPIVRVIGTPGPQGQLEADINGGNILGRWKHQMGERSDVQLRAYYDRTYRDDPSFEDSLDTADIDFQHRMAIGRRHQVLWGMNYRFNSNKNRSKGVFAVEPETSDNARASLFIQDQIRLFDDLQLTIGTKFENNDFSGFEVQPTARVAWNLTPSHIIWGAISRAVRVPTRLERDIAVDAGFGANGELFRLVGNEEFDSEEMLAYEVGYRWHPLGPLSLDLAAFRNQYEGISSLEPGEPFVEGGDQVVVPLLATNLTDGHSQGIEAQATYKPAAYWRLTASYSYLDMNLESAGLDINFEELIEGSTPRHQLGIRSSLDWRDYQFDLQLRYQDEIRSIPAIRTGETIPRYTEMDIRIARRIGEHAEISLVGQNLLNSHHPEFGEPSARGEVERSVYGKIAIRF